jgi:uncharacterized protein with GYD domain
MPKYMFQIAYTGEGHAEILKEGGTQRREAIETAIKSMNGWMEAFYYTFGEADMVVIADLPDNVSAAAFSLLLTTTGSTDVKTTVLIAPIEIDLASKKSASVQVLQEG